MAQATASILSTPFASVQVFGAIKSGNNIPHIILGHDFSLRHVFASFFRMLHSRQKYKMNEYSPLVSNHTPGYSLLFEQLLYSHGFNFFCIFFHANNCINISHKEICCCKFIINLYHLIKRESSKLDISPFCTCTK